MGIDSLYSFDQKITNPENDYNLVNDEVKQILDSTFQNTETCPNCDQEVIGSICRNCFCIVGEIHGSFDDNNDVFDYYNIIAENTEKTHLKSNNIGKSNYDYLDGTDKKIVGGVYYLKNKNNIKSDSGKVILKINGNIYRLNFNYKISKHLDHFNTDEQNYFVIDNISNLEVRKHGKRVMVKFYSELKNILKEQILLNPKYNIHLI